MADLQKLFMNDPTPIFFGGHTDGTYIPISEAEDLAVTTCFNSGLRAIERVSPKLAAILRPQLSAYKIWAGIAKNIGSQVKEITYPAKAGTIGVDWLTPALFGYYAGGSAVGAGTQDYSGYKINTPVSPNTASSRLKTWDITFVADTAAFLVGSSASAYYKAANGGANNNQLTVIAQDGIVEMNTTPSISQMRFITDQASQYSPFVENAMIELTAEDLRRIH